MLPKDEAEYLRELILKDALFLLESDFGPTRIRRIQLSPSRQ